MVRTLLTVLLVAAASISHASPELLFNQVIAGSGLKRPVRAGVNMFFAVSGPDFGIAKDDLFTGWTLIDAPPFKDGSAQPFEVGGRCFFRGNPMYSDGLTRLYVVDGNNALELAAATDPASAVSIHDVNGLAVFAFADSIHGMELWSSDGTPEGTGLLIDINPSGDSDPWLGAVAGGYLFFGADDGEHGRELWKTDGTVIGTTMVKDIDPGPDSSSPNHFEEVGGVVVFAASDDLAGNEPRRSDGTEVGTYLMRDLELGSSGSFPSDFRTVDVWAYFQARTAVEGTELYRTNGSVVQPIADINPTGSSYPARFHGYNGEVYFQADDGVHGSELWKTDGTLPGTQFVYDCYPGPGSGFVLELAVADGVLFFTAFDDVGPQLWRTEGTSGTTEIVEVNHNGWSNASGLISAGFDLIFGADDGTEVGHEPRRLDVAAGTITLAADLNPESGSNCEDLAAYGDDLLAIADHYWYGRDLWLYDLQAPENSIEMDETGFRESQSPPGATFAVDGDIVYFTGWQSETGFEVGAYDGADLYQVDVIPGPEGCDPTELVVANGEAFFVGLTAPEGNYGLYRLTAPPSPAAILVHEFGAVPPRDVTPFDASVVFVAQDTDHGEEIWRSTGVDLTQILLDINPGPDSSGPQALTAVGEAIFFTASEPNTGRELWVTDGTEAGTHLVEDARPGAAGSEPDHLTDGFPYLYCTAHTLATGREICRATPAGMELLDEIVPGPGSGSPRRLAFCGSRLFFSADDGAGAGREVWALDGETPTLVFDVNPGAGSSLPRDFDDHLGAVYFTADDGTSGRELWRASGTNLSNASDPIAPGPSSSRVGDRASVGNRLYFAAENEDYGREIWSVEDTGGPAWVSSPEPLAGSALRLRAGPNPFRERVQMRLEMAQAGRLRAELIDPSGRVVDQTALGRVDAGVQMLEWDVRGANKLSSGVYFLRVWSGEAAVVRKILHIR